jgi:cytochrome c oxidase cbb3-type subunit 3
MTDSHNTEIDRATGTATTGHVWDDIRELNTPLPRWWLWLFYATIIWSIGYWVVYPSWPLVSGYTQGFFGWQSRNSIVEDLADLKAIRGPMTEKLAAASLQDIVNNTELFEFARAQAKPMFGENCAPCHGNGGAGRKGFPNLNDDDWLWGGKLDEIAQTIRHGIRSSDAKTRVGGMPAFGRDGILKRTEIDSVAQFVRTLSGLPADSKVDLDAGKKVYADTCASCHGPTGKGNRDLGAPNLTDGIWLYGSDAETIADGLWSGRNGMMPAWGTRLDDSTVKALAVYVHSLGGGER